MTLFGKTLFTILLLALGTGTYFFYQSYVKDGELVGYEESKPSTQTPQGVAVGEPNPNGTTTKPEGKKIAFSQLIAQNGTYKCTVNQYVANMETKGTVYMHEGMLRGEFSTTVAGKGMDTTMIVRDGYTYTWTSMAPTMGYKAKMGQPDQQGTGADAKASGTYTWNGDQIGDYNCESWTVDQAMFTLPKSVTFTAVN